MMPKETPLSLDARSILAILQKQKSQLRLIYVAPEDPVFLKRMNNKNLLPFSGRIQPWLPYGGEKDLLWMQESWTPIRFHPNTNQFSVCYEADQAILGPFLCEKEERRRFCLWAHRNDTEGLRFYSPCYLPRAATRLLLHIAEVRIEALQDISEEDLTGEGFSQGNFLHRKTQFQRWWDQSHYYLYDWMSNPYVWVIRFEALHK